MYTFCCIFTRSMGCSGKLFMISIYMIDAYEKYTSLFGLKSQALRCNAKSKRSDKQCKRAAMRDKSVCHMHGGKSSGPVTEQGRKRCAEAHTIHGRETRQQRQIRSLKFKEMKALMQLLEN